MRSQTNEGDSLFLQLFLLCPLSHSHRNGKPTAGRMPCDQRPPLSLEAMDGCGNYNRRKCSLATYKLCMMLSLPKNSKQEPLEVFLMGQSSRRVCRIVFSAPRGSVSVLVWALNSIGLPEPHLLLLMTQQHPELEQREAAREAGILLF